jgi:hypothetical protein
VLAKQIQTLSLGITCNGRICLLTILTGGGQKKSKHVASRSENISNCDPRKFIVVPTEKKNSVFFLDNFAQGKIGGWGTM